MPGSLLYRYSPVPGASVPPFWVTCRCCGESFATAAGSLVYRCMAWSPCPGEMGAIGADGKHGPRWQYGSASDAAPSRRAALTNEYSAFQFVKTGFQLTTAAAQHRHVVLAQVPAFTLENFSPARRCGESHRALFVPSAAARDGDLIEETWPWK